MSERFALRHQKRGGLALIEEKTPGKVDSERRSLVSRQELQGMDNGEGEGESCIVRKGKGRGGGRGKLHTEKVGEKFESKGT